MIGQTEDPLFRSAAGMAGATNYAQWTFSLFAPYLRGQVLEVGCGVGTFTRLILRSSVEHLTSIDVAQAAVDHCRATIADPSVEFSCTDVEAVQGQFDLVVCMNVLEHIAGDQAALDHMLGLLAPRGKLFLLVPAHQSLYSDFDREAGHHRRYSKTALQRLLQRADARFTTQRLFYFNSIGAMGYFVVYRLMHKPGRADASGEIGLFDRWVVPWQRQIERWGAPFGLSVVAVISNGEGG